MIQLELYSFILWYNWDYTLSYYDTIGIIILNVMIQLELYFEFLQSHSCHPRFDFRLWSLSLSRSGEAPLLLWVYFYHYIIMMIISWWSFWRISITVVSDHAHDNFLSPSSISFWWESPLLFWVNLEIKIHGDYGGEIINIWYFTKFHQEIVWSWYLGI